jgi:hypothetical protein
MNNTDYASPLDLEDIPSHKIQIDILLTEIELEELKSLRISLTNSYLGRITGAKEQTDRAISSMVKFINHLKNVLKYRETQS